MLRQSIAGLVCALALLAGPLASSAAAGYSDSCKPQKAQASNGMKMGKKLPGVEGTGTATCNQVGGCMCTYEICTRTFDNGRKPMNYSRNIDCSTKLTDALGTVDLSGGKKSNDFPNGCKSYSGTVGPNKTWNGAQCKDSYGCTCYVTVCDSGGKVTAKDQKCIGLPH